MADPMKIRAANKDGVTEVKVLVSHEMETGQRKDSAGAIVPAWFITELTAKHNDKVVLSCEFGPRCRRTPTWPSSSRAAPRATSWRELEGQQGRQAAPTKPPSPDAASRQRGGVDRRCRLSPPGGVPMINA
jgi:sulfur-oxidizing protein SoxZ